VVSDVDIHVIRMLLDYIYNLHLVFIYDFGEFKRTYTERSFHKVACTG
jgi:hypothetical protein